MPLITILQQLLHHPNLQVHGLVMVAVATVAVVAAQAVVDVGGAAVIKKAGSYFWTWTWTCVHGVFREFGN